MSLTQLVVPPEPAEPNLAGPSVAMTPTAPEAPLAEASDLRKLQSQLEQLEQGIAADRQLRHEALNRLALLERTLHRLEALSQRFPAPKPATGDAKPVEGEAAATAQAGAASPAHAKPVVAVWEATVVGEAPETSAPTATESSRPVVEWLDWLATRVGSHWAPTLVDHYRRVGWIRADEHEALAVRAKAIPPDPPRSLSLETLNAVHEETRRRLGAVPVDSE